MRTATSRTTAVASAVLVVALVAAGFYVFPYLTAAGSQLAPVTGAPSQQQSSSATVGEEGDSTETNTTAPTAVRPFLFSSFSPSGGDAITYPPDYAQIANYTLGQINGDRAAFNLSAVALSTVPSGQQHADSMLFFGYFSHWDTQGLKPYARYSLLNGTGAVEENVAYELTHSPTFTTVSSVEDALGRLENQMIYNDSTCCQNEHRMNILDPLHNVVSIGVAYNSTRVYLVEDFENSYITLSQPATTGSSTEVDLMGNSSMKLDTVQVVVYQDPLPENLTASQLDSPPYSGSYDAGNFVGGVVQKCLLSCEKYQNGLTVSALQWTVSGTSVQIQFMLDPFVSIYGAGIYTVYLETLGADGTPEPLISTCVFITS